MENKNFLATEPVGKLLRQLALPTVIAQLINMLYNIVDRYLYWTHSRCWRGSINRCGVIYANSYAD